MIFRMLRNRRTANRPPRLPDGIRIYAIGDVHGRADLLEKLSLRIDAHASRHPIQRPINVLIGDYIDRGPASRQVIDLLLDMATRRETVLLRGNHEVFVKDFILDPTVLRTWSKLGGLETLMSYGLRPPINPDRAAREELSAELNAVLPSSHRHLFENLRTSLSFGDYFFAHAGVRPGVPLSKQKEEDLMWIRDEFLLHEGLFGKIVVHGHTPVQTIDIRPNRINIDTGAYATGRLSCLILERDYFEPLEH